VTNQKVKELRRGKVCSVLGGRAETGRRGSDGAMVTLVLLVLPIGLTKSEFVFSCSVSNDWLEERQQLIM